VDKFFIVGCPRSGTTMVQQALNRHSQIAIPPETKFFFSFFRHPHKAQLQHIERLNNDLNICLPVPTRQVYSLAEGRTFYEIMASRYLEQLQKKDVTCFGEKTPEHTGYLFRIREIFPGAKILVVYRDGRDVALSLTRMPWTSSDLYVNFMVWLYYQWVIRKAQPVASPNVYFARYEDIVADPEKEFRPILHFLGLPYESAVAEGCGNREGIPEREYVWKGRALQKITTERVGVFRRELNATQIATLERLGAHALSPLGYQLVTEGKMPLSPRFLFNLTCNFSKFVCSLPWNSVRKEIVNFSFLSCPSGKTTTRSLSPVPV
jgi:hypothetical protein